MQIVPNIYRLDKQILKLRGLSDYEIILLKDFNNQI